MKRGKEGGREEERYSIYVLLLCLVFVHIYIFVN